MTGELNHGKGWHEGLPDGRKYVTVSGLIASMGDKRRVGLSGWHTESGVPEYRRSFPGSLFKEIAEMFGFGKPQLKSNFLDTVI
jgi:hypothetical protein